MTPLLNASSPAEQLYNESQIRTRGIIERTFGVWKRRFPVLAYGCRLRLSTTLIVIVATSILHNIAKRMGDDEAPPSDDFDSAELEQNIGLGEMAMSHNSSHTHLANTGAQKRLSLINNYFSRL